MSLYFQLVLLGEAKANCTVGGALILIYIYGKCGSIWSQYIRLEGSHDHRGRRITECVARTRISNTSNRRQTSLSLSLCLIFSLSCYTL